MGAQDCIQNLQTSLLFMESSLVLRRFHKSLMLASFISEIIEKCTVPRSCRVKFVEELKKVRVRSYLNFFDMLPIYGTPTSRSVRLLARVIGEIQGKC